VLPIFTAAEMRTVDARAISELGIPGPRLMEHAGAGAARLIAREFAPIRSKRVVVVCGKGNNGGDGFVVARRLKSQGARVRVVLAARRADVTGDAALALGRWRGPIVEVADDTDLGPLATELRSADVVVDALLGTGLSGPARGIHARLIEAVNAARRPVVALDLPSGLSSDHGALLGPAVEASMTATFAGYKRSLVLTPASRYAGRIAVIDIGIPQDDVQRGATAFLLEKSDVRRHFPPRAAESHKGTFGHLLVIAGSLGKTGAAALAGRSALRSGVGLCTVATPESQQPIVASLALEYMTEPLAETDAHTLSVRARERILELVARADAVALGPGLSQHPETQRLIQTLVAEIERPMVVDADGLNALAEHLELLETAVAPRVLTPHPGEMARMLGTGIAEVQKDRLETVRAFCARRRAVACLKGAGTVIGGPSGPVFVNPTGNPGMASGGSGDVLTGMVGAFLARGLEPLDALQAACFLHGQAGDLARLARGEEGLIASDMIEEIPRAMFPSAERA
jgi:NAD(P)H-hydrate epimerase